MTAFIKRLSDGQIFQLRCSEIPKGNDGDFNIVWELFDSEWKIIDTPKYNEYSFVVNNEDLLFSYQLSIDSFL